MIKIVRAMPARIQENGIGYSVLWFGKIVDGYDVPVLNEREVRASAGIFFFLALVSFMHSWLVGEFLYTKIFVVAFGLDFIVRVLVNPEFAPSLVVGRLIVSGQNPEYVDAAPKRFAWTFGLLLAVVMSYLLVVNDVKGPLNLVVCATCLIMLFCESAFGICLACKLYNLVLRKQTRYCPGGVCTVRHSYLKTLTIAQVAAVVTYALLIIISFPIISRYSRTLAREKAVRLESDSDECTPPDWAIKIGHAEMWKLHHGCKDSQNQFFPVDTEKSDL